MRKKYLLIGLLIFAYLSGHAQSETVDMRVKISRAAFQAKQIVPPAPEAAELGKYGNTPMSLFSGTANISIPLTELQGQSLALPISLSYNATGFKPAEFATWVGQSWSLNAGGVCYPFGDG